MSTQAIESMRKFTKAMIRLSPERQQYLRAARALGFSDREAHLVLAGVVKTGERVGFPFDEHRLALHVLQNFSD
jgi:hypothetical protein